MSLRWKVNTGNLFREILSNPGAEELTSSLRILSSKLAEIGERAVVLDDPVLNQLMIELAIYSVGDQESEDYDRKVVEKVEERFDQHLKETP